MSSGYPGAIDVLTDPVGTNSLGAPLSHATLHADVNDAIEKIEATLGINPQGASATVVARLGAIDTAIAAKDTQARGRAAVASAGTWGVPGEWVPANVNPAAVAVGADDRMVLFGFTCHDNITLTALAINVTVAGAAGGVCEVALYAASFEDQTGYRPGAKIGASLGTVAVDSTGQKTITGLTRALTKGTAYVIGLSFSKTCTVYRMSVCAPAQHFWRGDNLNLGVQQQHIAAAYPPPDPASGAIVSTTTTAAPHNCPFACRWTTP